MANYNQVSNASTIHEYTLSNGLKLIVAEYHKAPVVLNSVWYKVGSCYEPKGKTGISHMLEHMMFRGTNKYLPGQLQTMVTAIGGQQNAMTGSDFTTYHQTVPANQLAMCLQLESDRMHNLLIQKNGFDQEKKVVMEERRMRVDDDPQTLAQVNFQAKALAYTPYHHPIIGWKDDINKYRIKDVTAWYNQWYAPNNAVVIVVGAIDPQETYLAVRDFFGSIPSKKIPLQRPVKTRANLGRKDLTIHIPTQVATLFIGFNVPSLITAEQSWHAYALEVIAAVLDLGISSRLTQKLIHQQRAAVRINVRYDLYSLHSGLFMIHSIAEENHSLSQLEKSVLDQVALLTKKLVPKSELNRVKSQLIARNIFSRDSIYTQAMQLGTAAMIGLSWHSSYNYIKFIQEITPQHIQNAAQLFFKDEVLTVAKIESDC